MVSVVAGTAGNLGAKRSELGSVDETGTFVHCLAMPRHALPTAMQSYVASHK